MRRVGLHNLGCKVNGYEADVIAGLLKERGYTIVPFDTPAEVYIINTCTVTNIADRKTRQMLRRARAMNPDALVVAMGCYVDTHASRGGPAAAPTGGAERADTAAPLWDIAVTNADKGAVVDLIDRAIASRAPAGTDTPDSDGASTASDFRLHVRPARTRATIKIQDGCDQFCSYCVIPYARGRIRSRSEEDIAREVEELVEQGVREVVLTGIHLSSFGRMSTEPAEPVRDGMRLLELVGRLSGIEGLSRIRLGSLEPRIITEDFVAAAVRLPRLCPHFHLSLQSGCDSVLTRMNRHYTTAEYEAGVKLLREAYDRPAITTDVITGFPGETDEEFGETVDLLTRLELYEIHVFRFSAREGTVAARMPGQLTERVKAERSDVLLKLTARQAALYRESFAGEEADVLWEDVQNGLIEGYTDRYIRVTAPEGSATPGSITRITL